MIEKAFTGGRRYWVWLAALALLALAGGAAWLRQLDAGLAVTGLGRDVSWGLYIAQFTFLVGVAASAVVVVLPCYLHDWKAFGRIVILGELLAVAAVTCSVLFVMVDMGQPARLLNLLRYPSPSSMMFWDMLALGGYLALNAVIAWQSLSAERNEMAPPRWLRPLVLLSIPWAISIHTVTAFLYSGLPGRSFWLTALMAPRFLASAFAAGPSLLLLVALLMRRIARYDVGDQAIDKLSVIVSYAMVANVFFLLMEAFTAFYSQIPAHLQHFQYLYVGFEGRAPLAIWMWSSAALAVASLLLLIVPRLRTRRPVVALAALGVVVSIWIDKGLGLIVGGFVPTPLEEVAVYAPTPIEMAVTLGIWAIGAMLVTLSYNAVVSVRTTVKGSKVLSN